MHFNDAIVFRGLKDYLQMIDVKNLLLYLLKEIIEILL